MRAKIQSVQVLGIGSAGLGVRGNRDEDGTHTRLLLDDESSVIYREYSTTTQMSDVYLNKEMAVIRALNDAGLPTPLILTTVESGARSERDPAALLLSDGGGAPLEEEFRTTSARGRVGLWASVGEQVRSLHEVDTDLLEFLNKPVYQRPWTRMVSYLFKALRNIRTGRPEFRKPIDAMIELRLVLEEYFEARPRAVCFNGGYYLPGMMMLRDGSRWRCGSWMSLGYYVSISDPARDVVSIGLHHREWTGDNLPASFYKEYGSRPDPLAEMIYTIALQLKRGVAYENSSSGLMRKGYGPPPFSTAVEALHQLPETVERIRALLAA